MSALLVISQVSQANLMISPTRVVFEDREKSTEVTLVNNSRTEKTYRIELQNKIQNEAGSYVNVSADTLYPGKSAIDMIRYSPRVVTIAPGKFQKIRLHLRKPGELLQGEYRVHLAMVSIGNSQTAASSGNPEGMTTQMLPRMSFSIPVIVRHGSLSMQAGINSVELEPKSQGKQKPNLAVTVRRQGSSSSYGSLSAYMKEPGTGQVQQIGKLNNVAVYTELGERKVRMPLWVEQIPDNAIIQVIYDGDEEYKGTTLGTAAFRYSVN